MYFVVFFFLLTKYTYVLYIKSKENKKKKKKAEWKKNSFWDDGAKWRHAMDFFYLWKTGISTSLSSF